MEVLGWLNLYAVGVVIVALIMLYDLRKMQDKGYVLMSESMKRVAMLSLWSWVFVFFRLAVWLVDFLTYWYVWVIFKHKVRRNKKQE